MEYLTELPGALVLVGADVLTVKLSPTTVLNDLNSSHQIQTYIVDDDASGAGTLEQGDYLAPVINGQSIPGKYLGTGTIQNVGLSLGSMTDSGISGLLALGISVSVNPIHGDLFEAADGKVYFISADPLSAERISATLTVNLPGTNNKISITAPISELSSALQSLDPTGLLGTLLGPVGNLGQYLMDTALLTMTSNPYGIKVLSDYQPLCFCAGTKIMTPQGELAIEDLRIGDQVLSFEGGFRTIRWIGHQTLSAARLAALPRLRPIRISAGSLGQGVPQSDLRVSPQHRVLLSSDLTRKLCEAEAVLIAAVKLVGLPGISVEAEGSGTDYYHLLLDRHDVVLANGAWSETLFSGPMALKALSPEARAEIALLFPEFLVAAQMPRPALPFVTGKESKRLVQRHLRKGQSLYDPSRPAPPPQRGGLAHRSVS